MRSFFSLSGGDSSRDDQWTASHESSLTTAEISEIFAVEVAAANGTVSDTFDDGSRLLARSVLPSVHDVRPKDGMQGGVAIRASGPDVWVHPYVFRLVCRNGAIVAHSLESRHFEWLDAFAAEEARQALREAVRACCVEDAFPRIVRQIRSAAQTHVDLALTLLPMLSRFGEGHAAQLLRRLLPQLFKERDQSRFGVGNAVTAVWLATPTIPKCAGGWKNLAVQSLSEARQNPHGRAPRRSFLWKHAANASW